MFSKMFVERSRISGHLCLEDIWIMANKQYTTEAITHKLRKTDVLIGRIGAYPSSPVADGTLTVARRLRTKKITTVRPMELSGNKIARDSRARSSSKSLIFALAFCPKVAEATHCGENGYRGDRGGAT
jgi:hypothetical protein